MQRRPGGSPRRRPAAPDAPDLSFLAPPPTAAAGGAAPPPGAAGSGSGGGLELGPAQALIDALWADSALPSLCSLLAVPSRSPSSDPAWETNGLLDRSIDVLVGWVKAQQVEGLAVEVLRPGAGVSPGTPRSPFANLPLPLTSPLARSGVDRGGGGAARRRVGGGRAPLRPRGHRPAP